MAQKRNEELENILTELQTLSSSFLTKLTDEELIKLKNELSLRKSVVDAISKMRIHYRTHHPHEKKD